MKVISIILHSKTFKGIPMPVASNLDSGWSFKVLHNLDLGLFIFKTKTSIACTAEAISGCILLTM